jgi:hypothetical protein
MTVLEKLPIDREQVLNVWVEGTPRMLLVGV